MPETPETSPDPTTADATLAIRPKPSAPSDMPRIKQPHGGSLLAGGVKGNRGGGNPAAIKARCRADFVAMLPKVRSLVKTRKDKKGNLIKPDPAIIIRVTELFGKFGLDDSISVTDIREALIKTKEEIDELLPPEQAEMLWNRIASHWVSI